MNKIKLKDFRHVIIRGNNALNYRADAKITVVTTTGFFKKKKTEETREIHKEFVGSWYFSDTGKYCPPEVEDMQRAYEAAVKAKLFKI